MIIISIMLLVLAAGGVGGYVYLNSMDGGEEAAQEESTLPEFDAGIKAGAEVETGQIKASGGLSLGGLLSGEKDCGREEVSGSLANLPEGFGCMGQAFLDGCIPAKYTMVSPIGDATVKLEGKSGSDCLVYTDGGWDMQTKTRMPALSCKVPIAAGPAVAEWSKSIALKTGISGDIKTGTAKTMWSMVAISFREGTHKIGVTEYSATCAVK